MNIAQLFATASQHHASGNLTLASEHYRRILEAEPNHAEALHRLGSIAQQQGHQQLAIDFLTRAVTGNGTNASHWYSLGMTHISAGNHDEAVNAFEQALRLRPEYAEASNNLGFLLQQRGELERAIAWFQHSLQYKPANPAASNNMGNALNQLGKWEQAVAFCQQALASKPDFADALNNLGLAYHKLGKLAQAEECYRKALRLQPAFAIASNNLATLLKEQGRLAESLVQFRETLKLHTCHAMTFYSLGKFAAEGLYQFGAAELAHIEAQLADGRVSLLERSLHAFTLGGVYERQDCPDQVFEYYRQANDLRKQYLAKRKPAFDADRQRLLVDRIIATFDRAYFQRVQEWGLDTELPVFVVGMPRTGSTLVEQILSSHPQVFGAGEINDLRQIADRLASAGSGLAAEGTPIPLADRTTARKMAGEYLKTLSGLAAGASRVIDKTLLNFLYLGSIATLFPRARIIHCTRHPLDVGVSCYFQNFEHLDFSWSLEDIGAYYRQYERLMAHWRETLPLQIHEVCYEQLIEHQQPVSRSLVAFCGLEWDERCLAFFKNRRTVSTASSLQVRKPLTTHSIGRWKRFRAHLGPLIKALGPVLGNPNGQLLEASCSTNIDRKSPWSFSEEETCP